MGRKQLLSGVALAALLAGPPVARAALPPIVFGEAQRGDLRVVSDVLLSGRAAEMMGVWFDDSLACSQWRRLRVAVFVEYTRGRTSRTVRRARTGAVRNCVEGGPNFGFVLRARSVGLACPDGRWRPGHYTFDTRTTHVASRTRASATLLWSKSGRC